MPRNPYNRSCNPCRERHLKCDRVAPSCTNCTKSRYLMQCSYEPVRFKFRTCIPAQVEESEPSGWPSDQHSSPRQEPATPKSNAHEDTQRDPPSEPASSPSPHASGETIFEPSQVQGAFDSSTPLTSPQVPDPSASTAVAFPDTFGQDPLPPVCFPSTLIGTAPSVIADQTEASIYSFYLQTAGPWLDIVSPNRFFGLHVPQLAATETALLSACLAYASQVLYLHGRIAAPVKETLHDRTLRLLTPLLTTCQQSHPLGSILATTVLLRMTEQFLELGEDRQHHLYGSSTLFESEFDEWSIFDQNLSSTAFWAYLRGSIRVSFMLERPSPFELGRLQILNMEYAAKDVNLTDEAYTNIMTYLIAELCTAVWGTPSSPADSAARVKRLEQAISDWRQHLPPSFQPWYVKFDESDTFPDVRYLASWHYVAWQFFYAAQIMLAVYSPTIGSESNVFNLTRLLEQKIATPTRWLCGVTLSASDCGVKINGSHLVAWSAQFVTGKAEQGLILRMLLALWEETGWPNQTSCARLRGIWDGSRPRWVNVAESPA
ncbi:hypothetical protein ASPVEDRAFT_83580 [Aspergillus versicolor CBS 583.65]|uniref:Zn(2)-C6 fungal-type domain-containing protein n=1 Tax=Aspergillus versicolor CBS 583.65 TaxID=1036611 RepID=A0A1L9PKK4_ASPVE|nr:uncharacterized protein ASPVEDRAFT_83580 [Aspergillus versicolor CBS 583.65]OJJ02060.1 hypothetical protein ASPVEDRAFT_83580 [Aspergillus versicolor CBS 583.65]